MTTPRLLISGGTILSMDGSAEPFAGYVATSGGRIAEVGAGAPRQELVDAAAERIDAAGCIVMPGLISTHQHVSDILLRGVGLGLDLFEWALGFYHPGTGAMRPEDARLAVELAMAEGLRAGVTTLVDNWSAALDPVLAEECAEAALEAYARTGVRVVFGRQFSDTFPLAWTELMRAHGIERDDVVEDIDAVVSGTEQLAARHHRGRVSVCLAPAAAQTATPAALEAAREMALRLDTPLTIHHCETRREARMDAAPGQAQGPTTTEHLQALGVLDSRLLAAHCVWLQDDDFDLLARAGARVAHCPTSNLMLASGIAPVARLRQAGITVSLGSDNAMLNNNVALLPEARLAALLARGATLDAAALGADEALAMATREGARAIGLGDDLGVIAPGRLADLIVVEATAAHWVPCHDPAAAMLFQSQPGDVRDVVVDGDVVLRDRELSWVASDAEGRLHAAAAAAATALLERSGLRS